MANRFIGSVLSSNPQSKTSFSSRSSSGTYFDKNGTLVTATSNQPRLNYSLINGAWTQPTVLIEPASTNIVSYSEQFDNAFWTKGGASITANTTTAPDGTTTADTLTEASNTGEHIVYCGFASDAAYYTLSVFAKANTRNWITLYANGIWQSFNLSTGTVGTVGTNVTATIIPVGNGWYRCAVTRLMTATNNYWQVNIATGDNAILTVSDPGTSYTGNGTGSVYLWGAQVEKTYGMTSYIPTTTAAVTRAQDVVSTGVSGIYKLEDRQNNTSNDDQFTVTSFTTIGSTTWTAPVDVTSVEVLVVAGGGGGGGGSNFDGAGGGAGGLIYNTSYPVVAGTTYPVIVGAGGAGGTGSGAITNRGGNGSNSTFGNLIAIGGGGGGSGIVANTYQLGASGGSGGGSAFNSSGTNPAPGAQGTAGQGNPGGAGAITSSWSGGGGGGAGGPGILAVGNVRAGNGGPGLYFNISGTSTAYAGGGGGGSETAAAGTGGAGGGGNGQFNGSTAAQAGTTNTGGGGGGGYAATGGAGGSGIVIIKYKRTSRQLASTSNAAIVTQKFIISNTWTVPAGVTQVEALVVAGGGGGGNGTAGGGGGAGGVVYNSALAVTPGATYTIGVGTGGVSALDQASQPAYNGYGSGIGTGTELVTNGTGFTTTTGWTATTSTLSVPSTGVFRILPNASVNGTASQSITTVNGVTYLAIVNVIQDSTKNFRLRIGTTQLGGELAELWPSYTTTNSDFISQATGRGIYSTTFTATGTTTWINMQVGGGTQQATDISYISIRQATLPAFGGGSGGSESATAGWRNGGNGGSGGGTSYNGVTVGTGTAGQGNAGGLGTSGGNNWTGGGGGGAGGVGGNASKFYPGYGGPGVAYSITGNIEYYGGGGGGSSQNSGGGTVFIGMGGIGGGGTGAADPTGSTALIGQNGAPNTGGGGGAQADVTGSGGTGKGDGGSGVVILRYRVPQVATFLDSGSWTCPAGVTTVQALIVAGGGSGGANNAGGGGAGGLIYDNSISVTPGVTYPVIVGQGGLSFIGNWGGAAGSGGATGFVGQNSSFANLIAIGGGGGMGGNVGLGGIVGSYPGLGTVGGSGGGQCRGVGAIPLTVCAGTYIQGNNGGGNRVSAEGGGGGGAGSAGFTGDNSTFGGKGGIGLAFSISGSSVTYAGGGGGGAEGAGVRAGTGGIGGGGSGSIAAGATAATGWNLNYGQDGTPNTGGGGGAEAAGNAAYTVGKGGSGIVIIRWNGS